MSLYDDQNPQHLDYLAAHRVRREDRERTGFQQKRRPDRQGANRNG